MKRIFSILFLLAFLLTGCGKEEPVETTTAPAVQTEAEATQTTGPEGVLEETGETVYVLVQFTHLDENGNVNWYLEYDYNDQGIQIAKREIAGDGSMTFEQWNTLDEQGNVTLAETYRDGELVTYNCYAYDEQGNVTLDTYYEEGQLLYEIAYTYDDQGSILTMDMTTMGEITQSLAFAYTYDENGNILTREETMDGELSTRTEMTYDGENRCIREITCDAAGEVMSRTEATWEGTTETKCSYDGSGYLYLTEVSTYDENGNITFRENQYTGGQVTQNEYTYATIEIKK